MAEQWEYLLVVKDGKWMENMKNPASQGWVDRQNNEELPSNIKDKKVTWWEHLQELGDIGWELVDSHPAEYRDSDSGQRHTLTEYIFKRPKKDLERNKASGLNKSRNSENNFLEIKPASVVGTK